jgi:hypothetical protein
MARMDNQEQVEANMANALKAVQPALAVLQKVGKTARVLQPHESTP